MNSALLYKRSAYFGHVYISVKFQKQIPANNFDIELENLLALKELICAILCKLTKL